MYVVTGTTGNTGSIVASQLLDAGRKVRGIGRSADRMQRLAQLGGEPFVAELTDREALSRAFQGAVGAYLMIPPNLAAADFRAYQGDVTEAIAAALESSEVKHAVVLSSVGADKEEKTGPVVGLHRLEERLKSIAGMDLLFLRCGYFMENFLMQVPGIQQTGALAGLLDPELPLPMIAARDIGEAAAEALINFTFTGKECRELLGPADLSMNEAAAIIGKAIGRADLQYKRLADEQMQAVLVQAGMSEDMAAQIVEMSAALNSGHMRALELRGARNTTPTTFAAFVQEAFVPAYRGSSAA
jgi:uncharacterized protein YbjT (DUF2867 family)